MTWIVIGLLLGAGVVAVGWLLLDLRNSQTNQRIQRRTAELRLQAQRERQERRRKLGLPNDPPCGPHAPWEDQ